MKLKIFIVCVFTSLCSFSLFAATAYEKKVHQIYVKYYTLFKYGRSHSNLTYEESFLLQTAPGETIGLSAWVNTYFSADQTEKYMNNMDQELKAAETLMTAEEKQQTFSAGYLEYLLSEAFRRWAQQDEFEKTTDYQERIKKKSESFFIGSCKTFIPKIGFSIETIKYDADKEVYDLQIGYTVSIEYGNKYFSNNKPLYISIHMSGDTARLYKEKKLWLSVDNCILGVQNGNITPQSYEIFIGDDSHKKIAIKQSTKVPDLIVKGSKIAPQNEYLKNATYNFSQAQGKEIEQKLAKENYKTRILEQIEEYNNVMPKIINDLNDKIKGSALFAKIPAARSLCLLSFTPRKFTINDNMDLITEYYNEQNIAAFVSRPIDSIVYYYDPSIEILKTMLRTHSSSAYKTYFDLYFEIEPDSAKVLRKEYSEYYCYYEDFYQFAAEYVLNTLDPNNRNCRQITWEKYGQLYGNRQQFEADYDKGIDTVALYIHLVESLNALGNYLNMEVENPASGVLGVGSFLPSTKKMSSLNFQGAFSSNNEHIKKIGELYKSLTPYPSQQKKMAEILITQCEKIKDEYGSKGSLFQNSTEFINAYFSANYKNIIKSKK